MKGLIKVIYSAVLLSGALYSQGQTCCSGGVPLSNNIGLPAISKGGLQLNLSYDYNNLSTLIQNTEKLDNKTRTRISHTALLQAGMALSNRFSMELLIPYIKQDRRITQAGNVDFTSTSGLGDITGLISFQVLKPSVSKNISVSLGLKAPTGAIDNKNDIGIVLNSDLQPGSGAWDVLTLLRYINPLGQNKNINFYAGLMNNFKGINPDYQPGLSYQFGHEQQLSVGLNGQFFALNNLWNLGAGLRLRNVSKSKINEQKLSNTGGKWILANANVSYWLIPAKTSFSFSTDIPLITSVNGLQNVPTYRINFSLYSLIKWRGFNKEL